MTILGFAGELPTSSLRHCAAPEIFLKDRARSQAQGLAQFDKFDSINSTFAALDLRYEGLGISEALCEYGLGNTSRLPQLTKQDQQELVIVVMRRAGHELAGSPPGKLESRLE